MRRAVLMLLLATAACAPTREDFAEVCAAEVAATPVPPRVAAVLNEEQQIEYRAGSVRICQTSRMGMASLRQQESRAMVAAIVFGAASDALATHNFYTYRVPEARRYLERSR